jgi:hypothetical protein
MLGGIMKKIAVLILATCCLFFASPSAACDKEAARKVQAMLKNMATWYEKDNEVAFKWGNDWDHATPDQRLGLIRTFADSDACLTGKAREIKFYRKGKLVGKASPTWGIKLLDK